MVIEGLSVDELVAQDRSVEDSFHFHRGIWWREVRPFFYQPAFFLQPVDGHRSSPRRLKALLGYHHVVQEGQQANSCFKMLMLKDVKSYSLDSIYLKARNAIRKAQRLLEVKRITEVNDLLTGGYEAYVSFRRRTNWGRDKTNYDVFSHWITRAFRLEKRFFLGAYFEGKLIAYMTQHLVEGIAAVGLLISHSDYLRYRPNDLLLHTFLTLCRRSPGVTMAQIGPASLRPSLDRFKMKFGFEAVSYPTYVWINPFVRPLLRRFYTEKYNQLLGRPAGGAEGERSPVDSPATERDSVPSMG